jgi:hypothetical protein
MVNPRGRPPKLAPGEKRTTAHQITVRLNEVERAELDHMSVELRASAGDVVRRALAELYARVRGGK